MHKCNVFLYFPRNQPTKIMIRINTTTEMILAIANAINELDIKTLIECREINNTWLQSESEYEAIDALIDAALGAID